MSEARALRRQVKAEARAFKKSAEKSLSDLSISKQIDNERKAANRAYRSEIKELRSVVRAESKAAKAFLN